MSADSSQWLNKMVKGSSACNVGVSDGKAKDTALSRGDLHDFQSLQAAHCPWNFKKSGKRYYELQRLCSIWSDWLPDK